MRRLLVSSLVFVSASSAFVAKEVSNRQRIRLALAADNSQQQEESVYYSPNAPLRSESSSESIVSSPSVDSSSEYSFFDQAIIQVKAGSGGQGSTAYKLIGRQQGPPDGGNGGMGGSVILQVDPSLNTLAGLSSAWRPNSFGGSGAATSGFTNTIQSFKAEHGHDGERQCKSGRNGKDIVVRVPPGTQIQQVLENGEHVPMTTLTLVDNPSLIVARGGMGGEGTAVLLKTGRGVKRPRQSATGGERKRLLLTLKIVADVALVAVPNAGKSTLLAAVTRAKPKIANYPFTTVIPNLGVWVPEDTFADDESATSGSDGLVLCDVPGLVAGASQGVGLGHAFLRHVERCHVILHLVDATSHDPIADYAMLNKELVNYGTGQLANMPQVVVINKVDALEGSTSEEWEEGLKAKLTRRELEERMQKVMPHSRLMWISAKESAGVDELMTRLAAFVKKVKSEALAP